MPYPSFVFFKLDDWLSICQARRHISPTPNNHANRQGKAEVPVQFIYQDGMENQDKNESFALTWKWFHTMGNDSPLLQVCITLVLIQHTICCDAAS